MKPCSLFELMCDIVLEWVKRNNICLPQHHMNDLRKRLSNAQATLKHKFVCKKANRINIPEQEEKTHI